MGHQISFNTFSATNSINDIIHELTEFSERDGDSGGIYRSFKIVKTVFNSIDEADNWINDNDVSYGNFIVKAWSKTPPKNTKSYLDLFDKILEIKSQIVKLQDVINNFKSAYISCKTCNSKISIKYMKLDHKSSHCCPVCGASFINATLNKKISSLEEKISKLNEKIKNWESKHNNKLVYRTKIEFHV